MSKFRTPEMLSDDELEDLHGAGAPKLMEQISNGTVVKDEPASTRKDLIAHGTTQTVTASYNPKEISIDKSVPWQKHE